MADNIVHFDQDTPKIEQAAKVRSVLAVNGETGEVGAVEFELLVNEAGKRTGDAIKVVGNELPTMGEANKRYSVTTGTAGLILTYGSEEFELNANSQVDMFWDGLAETWEVERQTPLPAVPVPDVSGFTEKGGYEGTAQDLLDEIPEVTDVFGESTEEAATQRLVTEIKNDLVSKISLVQNRAYIFAIADQEGKILAGIKKDGNLYFNSTALTDIASMKIDIDYLKDSLENLQPVTETISIVSNDVYLLAIVDDVGGIVLGIKKDGNLYFNSILFDRVFALEQSVINLNSKVDNLDVYSLVITAWGDSLTRGAGSDKTRNKSIVLDKLTDMGFDVSSLSSISTPYPTVLQVLLNDPGKYTVNNLGTGGEDINTIIARQGAIPALLPYDIILPSAAGVDVEIANSTTNLMRSAYDNSGIYPLLQGDYGVNPVYVESRKCQLRVVTGTPNLYYLRTMEVANRDITIPAGTPIFMKGAKDYRKTDIAIIWCWQNGGYHNDNDELIIKLDRLIENIGTSKYLLIGRHRGTEETLSAQELALTKRYGNKFLNWRRYVSTNALYDFNITPTTDADFTSDQLANGVRSDEYQMSVGGFPSSLWSQILDEDGALSNDDGHMNSAGYIILGYKIYERFVQLGYINNN